jgi:L-ribulokinase
MVSGTDRVVVGVDLGTLSARAVVVRVADGEELGAAVSQYRHGVMDTVLAATGARLPPDWALQAPGDYVESLGEAVAEAVRLAGVEPEQVIGIGTDFTACTVLPVLADGTPLCELPEYADRPHAYVKLWKHHAAQAQADRLSRIAHERGEPWIARYGGKLSSEWELAKGLQLLEEDPELYDRMDHWVEAADWIVWQLCGSYVRNACTAGFKAARQNGGYPSIEYFAAVHPEFARFATDKLERRVEPLGALAGRLTAEAAARTGLPPGIAVCVGNVDAHVTAPAARAVATGQMVAIMGTSTCHVMIAEEVRDIPGMCGVVDGGIVPGLWAYEAGQSGVGDIFGWFVEHAVPADVQAEAARAGRSVHEHLSALAAAQPVGAHGLVALDWHSGNRSVLVDHDLSGLLIGLTLHTRPEDIYRALVESTAFGARIIVDTFEEAGVAVRDFIVAGGLVKSGFVMQLYADVLGRPLHVIGSEQGPAVGSALHAAVAAAAYPNIVEASAAMGRVERDVFKPDPARVDAYNTLFAVYRHLHDEFGRDGGDVMHRLRAIRRKALAG